VTGLNDNGATTINGKAAVTVSGVTDDTKIDLAGGNDQLTVNNGAVFPKDLRISIGSGTDTVSLANITVDGDLEVENRTYSNGSASGNDTVSLGTVTVLGDIQIQTGSGNDTVQISSSTFNGKLEVDLGAGDDSLSLVNSKVGNDFQVDGGDGFDKFTNQGNVFGGDVEIKNVESIS
jgi:hypothetical protein